MTAPSPALAGRPGLDEITADEYNALPQPKRSKYGNRRCDRDGYAFDSEAERRRYDELKLLERAGEITNAILQPEFPLIVNGTHIGCYIGDFEYLTMPERVRVIEDVKGVKTPIYRLKKKLVKAIYGIEITEVTG